jgi:hypothetical protein
MWTGARQRSIEFREVLRIRELTGDSCLLQRAPHELSVMRVVLKVNDTQGGTTIVASRPERGGLLHEYGSVEIDEPPRQRRLR